MFSAKTENNYGLSPWQRQLLERHAEHLKRHYALPIQFGECFCNLSIKPHILLAEKTETAMDDCLKMMLASLESFTRLGEVVLSIYDGSGTVFQRPTEPDRHRTVMRFPWEAVRELEWANAEMARRYVRLAQAQCRNLKEFNQKNVDTKMPLVVIVLHGLEELMSFQPKKNVGFILDRGYFCKENIRCLDKCNYSFVMMVKGVKALVSELILSTRGSFETDRDCHVREYKAYGKTVKARLYADDDKERFFHIYYTPGRAHAEREQFEARIEALSKYLKKQEGKKRQFGDSIRDYFTLEYARDKETFLFARERKDVVERELMLGGYFAIVTSEEMTAGDALTLCKSRDESEKLFRGDKSYLGNKAARVYSDESASAKIFIEFIALILRNKLYTYLKSAVLKNEKKANYMTVPAAIRELEKVEMIRLADGIYRLDHAVTATQKEILSAFGLNEDFVKQEAKRLSEELANLK